MRRMLFAAGVIALLSGFWFRSRKKLTADFAAVWGILGLLFVSAGTAAPYLIVFGKRFEKSGKAVCGLFLLGVVFWVSLELSKLKMQNQELAVRISLLLQENERMLSKLDEWERREKTDSVCQQYAGPRGSGGGASGASETD